MAEVTMGISAIVISLLSHAENISFGGFPQE